MIKIDPIFVERVKRATSYEDLFPLMQNAIELEHATIPPYLTAIFSLKPKTNNEIRKLIHSIVIEEMLHMSISSNILNALGSAPAINNENFVPKYPTKLPMGIGEDLTVGLANYSVHQVQNVFMRIEEPEHPIEFESLAAEPTFSTIGEFYGAIQKKIIELPGDKLPGDKKLQVTSSFFPANLLYPIHTTEEAVSAIDIIVRQGEGTTTTPFDEEGHLAHYYEFEELYKGRKLIKDPSAPNGYSFSGDVIPFDQNDVYPLFSNTKASMLPAGSEERRRADDFNVSYSRLLNGLHNTFNGCPECLDGTIGLMYDVKLSGEKLCATPFPGVQGKNIGPPFEFVDVND
jgi:Ferritin-like